MDVVLSSLRTVNDYASDCCNEVGVRGPQELWRAATTTDIEGYSARLAAAAICLISSYSASTQLLHVELYIACI